MADGGSNKGKFVAGCSCLSMLFFLALIIFINFGMAVVVQAVDNDPTVVTVAGILTSFGAWISDVCCCLSGVGVVIGIVMLATGGKKDAEA